MASKNRTLRTRKLNTPRAKCQQRSRRRDSLFWKAFEYCCECDADIFLMIRLKHNGHIFMFNSDSRWPLMQDMVGICYGNKETQFLIVHQFFQYPRPKTKQPGKNLLQGIQMEQMEQMNPGSKNRSRQQRDQTFCPPTGAQRSMQ
jgi:hypothetical protein